MADIEGEIIIHRPVEVVFDFVADERNEPLYNPAMIQVEKISEGPIAAGTRFKAETRTGKRTADMIIEFVSYERPHRLSSLTTMSAMAIEGTLIFSAVEQGTLMRWLWFIKPRGFLRIISPVIRMIGKRQEERIWKSLKCYLESRDI